MNSSPYVSHSDNPLLSAESISRSFALKEGKLRVIKELSLEIEEKELLGVIGPSGAGKSTLLHLLGLLERPDSGTISLRGEDIGTASEKRRAEIRNKEMGFIFQFHHLVPEFSALENVLLPVMIGGGNMHKAKKRAKELMEFVDISHRYNHKPTELSGGEQQRVALCRAMINSPKMVFADEPTGNLDSENAEKVHQLFSQLRESTGVSFLIVTHNEALMNITDRTLTMVDGRFSQEAHYIQKLVK